MLSIQLSSSLEVLTLTLCLAKFSVCTAFIGNEDSCMSDSIEISTNDDLETIAENTQNSWLMHYVLINKIYTLFYFRQHLAVTKVAEKYEATQKGKRALDFIPQYYHGLCKHTKRPSASCFTLIIRFLYPSSLHYNKFQRHSVWQGKQRIANGETSVKRLSSHTHFLQNMAHGTSSTR